MTDPSTTGPGMQLGFSIQPGPDGPAGFIGIHWDTPMAHSSIAVPLQWAEMLVEQFPEQLKEIIAQFKRIDSGLIVAPENALSALKGNH